MRPAVADPMGRDQFRHLAAVTLRQRVLRPCVELFVERPEVRVEPLHHLHHLGDGHAVVVDLQGEEGVVAHLSGDLVPEVAQPPDALLEGRSRLLGDLPDLAALGLVPGGHENLVDLVRRDDLAAFSDRAVRAELEGVQNGALLRFGGHARRDDLGNRPGVLGGAEENASQLAAGAVIELVFPLEQSLDGLDHPRAAAEGCHRLLGPNPLADMHIRDIGGGLPKGFGNNRVHALDEAVVSLQEFVRALLRARAAAEGDQGR